MSQLLIHTFLADLDRIRAASGSTRETVVREAFKDLLKDWASRTNSFSSPEYEYQTAAKEDRATSTARCCTRCACRSAIGRRRTRTTISTPKSNKKFGAAIRRTNIIFEDSHDAVLIQNQQEVMRCGVDDTTALEKLLDLFFGYERPEIAAIPQGGRAVQGRSAGGARSAARDDRGCAATTNASFPQGRREISRTRAGDDQSQP